MLKSTKKCCKTKRCPMGLSELQECLIRSCTGKNIIFTVGRTKTHHSFRKPLHHIISFFPVRRIFSSVLSSPLRNLLWGVRLGAHGCRGVGRVDGEETQVEEEERGSRRRRRHLPKATGVSCCSLRESPLGGLAERSDWGGRGGALLLLLLLLCCSGSQQ